MSRYRIEQMACTINDIFNHNNQMEVTMNELKNQLDRLQDDSLSKVELQHIKGFLHKQCSIIEKSVKTIKIMNNGLTLVKKEGM